jgi:hypothetical protein
LFVARRIIEMPSDMEMRQITNHLPPKYPNAVSVYGKIKIKFFKSLYIRTVNIFTLPALMYIIFMPVKKIELIVLNQVKAAPTGPSSFI